MKKFVSVLLALCLVLGMCAIANAATLSPEHGLVIGSGGEEYYEVRFNPATDIDDQNNITFNEYATDQFKRADVEALQVGDVIVSFGEEVTIETIEKNEDGITINGGFENEGVSLVISDEDSDIFINVSYDDVVSKTVMEARTMPMADEVKVVTYRMEEDGSYNGAVDEQTMPAGEVKAYMMDKGDAAKEDWINMEGDMTIFVEDDKITEIQVNWTPNA